jgi:Trk-type K+ transport system membrane component
MEHRKQPLLNKAAFLRRQLRFVLAALVFVAVSLAIGVAGYMHYAGFTFVDAFLNASMILGGMGPMGDLPNDGAKWFTACCMRCISMTIGRAKHDWYPRDRRSPTPVTKSPRFADVHSPRLSFQVL